MSVEIIDNITGVDKKLKTNMRKAFNTVALDIQRTSSDASPRDTGFLEKNHLNVVCQEDLWEATIFFRAFNKEFDYAEWTHLADYNLGKKSVAKQGGNSRFAGHVPVGRKYLARTVEQGADNYIKHVNDAFKDSFE